MIIHYMWCFKAFMAVRNYMTASLEIRGRTAQTTLVRCPQKPDTTQRTPGKNEFLQRVMIRTTLV